MKNIKRVTFFLSVISVFSGSVMAYGTQKPTNTIKVSCENSVFAPGGLGFAGILAVKDPGVCWIKNDYLPSSNMRAKVTCQDINKEWVTTRWLQPQEEETIRKSLQHCTASLRDW